MHSAVDKALPSELEPVEDALLYLAAVATFLHFQRQLPEMFAECVVFVHPYESGNFSPLHRKGRAR